MCKFFELTCSPLCTCSQHHQRVKPKSVFMNPEHDIYIEMFCICPIDISIDKIRLIGSISTWGIVPPTPCTSWSQIYLLIFICVHPSGFPFIYIPSTISHVLNIDRLEQTVWNWQFYEDNEIKKTFDNKSWEKMEFLYGAFISSGKYFWFPQSGKFWWQKKYKTTQKLKRDGKWNKERRTVFV